MCVSSRDFSVIIQGSIIGYPSDVVENQKTLHCLQSVRKVLPDAEIILSTWQGSDTSHLFYDKVIFNEDPGALSYYDNNKSPLNNSNRQIVSTYNGLKLASRKYSIKLRGDCQLKNLNFTKFLNSFNKRCKYPFFKERIIIPTVFSRNPRKNPILFHPSDIFQVGLTSDLKDLWDIPLQPEPQTTRAVPVTKKILNDPFPDLHLKVKFTPEQYIWYAFSKKNGLNLELKYYCNIPFDKIVKSEISIIDNFVIASPEQIGLILPQKFIRFVNNEDLYSFKQWENLYNKYSKKNFFFTGLFLAGEVYTRSARIIINRTSAFIKRSFIKNK